MAERTTTLYKQIYTDLKVQILDNELLPGEKIPTEFEIMEQYSVSRITASRALRDLSSDGYITRLRKSGSIVNDVHKRLANKNQDTDWGVIPLIMPFSPEVGFDLFTSVQQSVDTQTTIVALYNSERCIRKEREILEKIAAMNVKGIICFPMQGSENISYFTHFMYKNTPIIFVDRPLDCLDSSFIGTDNYTAMYKMTQWMISKGHTEISFCGYNFDSFAEKKRLKGYIKALLDNNIEPSNDYIIEFRGLTSGTGEMLFEDDSTISGVIKATLRKLMKLDTPPTAIMCDTDLLASFMMKQAIALDIAVPEQLSFSGFDNLLICDHLEVPLTTYAQDFRSIGKKAAELLNAGAQDWDTVLFQGEIIERKSVLDRTLL